MKFFRRSCIIRPMGDYAMPAINGRTSYVGRLSDMPKYMHANGIMLIKHNKE